MIDQNKNVSAKSILFTNRIAWLFILFSTPYAFIFYFLSPALGFCVIPFLLLYGVSLVFNRYGYYNLAKFNLLLWGSIGIMIYASAFGKESGIQMLYYAFSGVPLLIFSAHEITKKAIGIFIPLACFLIVSCSGYSLFPKLMLSPEIQGYLYTSVFLTVFSLIASYLFAFIWISNKSEKELEEANSQLEQKSIEIENKRQQAEELAQNLQHSYTELQDTHERLKESINTIEGMSHKAMLGGILQGIAHELNTPLTNIYSVSDRVLMKKDIDDQTATYMHDIFRCVERATSLMRLMLKDTTSVTNENKDIDVPEMITQIKHLVRDQAFRDKIQLEVLVADNLPAIKGTEVYVFQALLNLVVNALNHTKAGGKLTIEARDNPDTNHVQISITDTGEGIPEDILPHIFESGVSSKKGVLSAGLGLVFVKRVLDAHHATIHVSSTVGEGSCFTVAFPTLTSV